MALKAAILALALLVLWMVLFRPRRGGGSGPGRQPPEPDGGKPPPLAQELEPCPRCGVFRLPGGACECDRQPTSAE